MTTDPYTGPKTTSSERHAQLVKRGFSFVYPALAGLVLAGLALCSRTTSLSTPASTSGSISSPAPRPQSWFSASSFNGSACRFATGRKRNCGENTSPEVAAMRILEALCVAQGWDAALKWEVNAEENRLEFCSGWSAPGRRTESLLKDSIGLTMSPGAGMSGRAWQRDIRFGSRIWLPIRIPRLP